MPQIYGAASNFKIYLNTEIMAKQTEKGISGFVNNKGKQASLPHKT
jgi:hypothetical protein